MISLELIQEGTRRLLHPVLPLIDIRGFIVMITTLAINAFVMHYEYNKGRSLKSDLLISDSMHTRADLLISVSVILSLVAIKLGFPIFDPVITIVIALFIIQAGIAIVRQASRVLCDSAIVDVDTVEKTVLGVKGVKACHKIRTRGRPDDVYVDLHVQVSPSMHVDNAHKISYDIKEALKKALPGISDVVVHIEPKEKDSQAAQDEPKPNP